MNPLSLPGEELEQRLASTLLDVLIRAGLILAMAMLCYRVLTVFYSTAGYPAMRFRQIHPTN